MPVEDTVVKTDAVTHIEDTTSWENTKEAAQASAAEHETTIWQALKQNRKAAFWSAVISMCIVMEGYDVGQWLPVSLQCLKSR